MILRWPGLATSSDGTRPLMTPGERYRITYKTPSQRRYRESVMTFLELQPVANSFNSIWSARPVAGTQEIPVIWVTKIQLIERIEDAKVYINKVLPNG